MYILVDIIVVLLLVIAVWRGVKKGFFNTSFGLVGSLIVIALALLIAAVFTYVFHKLGAIDQIKLAFLKLIGENNGFLKMLHVTNERVAYYIALAIIGLPCFIVAYVLMLLVNKSFISFIEDCRGNTVFRVIDSTVGVIVNFALVAVVIYLSFAIVHACNAKNVLTSVDEVLRACPISNFIYNHNPFNDAMADAGIVNALASAFN